ncbi:MAG: NAD(+)/NADH kinase, partial [Alistipes sp.]|nr:NAD(+)/NADH kinase [Alistipes sp.]
MKIVLFSRPQIPHTAEDLRRLLGLIDHYGFDYAINQEFAQVVEQMLGIKIESEKIYGNSTGEQPEESVMVCCGGDGTLLEGIHRLSDKRIPVAGINFGHLGFLTSATRDGVESLFEQIAERKLNIQPRTMLSVEGGSIGNHFALNEVAAQRLEATMIKVEANVDNQLV